MKENYTKVHVSASLLQRVMHTAQRVSHPWQWVAPDLGWHTHGRESHVTLPMKSRIKRRKRGKRNISGGWTMTKTSILGFRTCLMRSWWSLPLKWSQLLQIQTLFKIILGAQMSTKSEINNQTAKTSSTVEQHKSYKICTDFI